jgi:hypothetical protein
VSSFPTAKGQRETSRYVSRVPVFLFIMSREPKESKSAIRETYSAVLFFEKGKDDDENK